MSQFARATGDGDDDIVQRRRAATLAPGARRGSVAVFVNSGGANQHQSEGHDKQADATSSSSLVRRSVRASKAPRASNACDVSSCDVELGVIAEEGSTKKDVALKNRRVRKRWNWQTVKHRIRHELQSGPVTMWMANVTVWSLFGDDLRLLATDVSADVGFLVMVYVCLASFALELAMSVLAIDGYAGGFYFWLDFVATSSLFMDIPQIKSALGLDQCQGVDSYGANFDQTQASWRMDGGNNDLADGGFARAGRASRAATRASRIIRIIRLFRLVKMLKTVEVTRERKQRDSLIQQKHDSMKRTLLDDVLEENTPRNEQGEVHDEDFAISESRVGQKLGDLTTKRVIIGVLLMLFVLPVFDVSLYAVGARQEFAQGGLSMAHEALVRGVDTNQGFYTLLSEYYHGTKGMYRLVLNGTDYSSDAHLPFELDGFSHKQLRCEEFEFVTHFSSAGDSHDEPAFSFSFFDRQHESRIQALLSVMRTIFVCMLLLVGAVLFNKDTNALVLRPLDRMMDKIQTMSENPLTQFTIHGDEEENQMETRMLENSISRICSLLAVGFGDAGSEIIAENMKRGGAIDPMIPGKKMMAIFGFCDIRQFTDTTEVLQEDIMEFVNTIAKIVHVEVHLHGGSANKNIGDAFLLVWKFPKSISEDILSGKWTEDPAKKRKVQMVADNALASFITIIGALRRSARLNTYRANKALNERISDFEVKMGFGLHVGWAIEGAIGSEHKVDASYLSPNVNMSARLEAATKQFGVPLLFTGEFAGLLSDSVRKQCRQIDCVTVKGSVNPVKLLTFDMHPENIEMPDGNVDPRREFEDETFSLHEYTNEFEQHPDIVQMRETVSTNFLVEFQKGLEHYIAGRWDRAKEILERNRTYTTTRGVEVTDGPTASLLSVMKARNFVAPADWKGFRELTEK